MIWRDERGGEERAGDGGAVEAIRSAAHPLTGRGRDFDPLLRSIGDARYVLLGEASHGTHDFYLARAQITQQLIEEKGFHAVVVEADWPDAYRVNRFVRGAAEDADAALGGFKRFPTWMWRNRDVVDFVTWLRMRNDAVPAGMPKVGFYGMDLYSLHTSVRSVLDYLDRVDPEAGKRARQRYSCFDHYGEDPQAYGYAAGFDLSASCADAVIDQLKDLLSRAKDYARRDGVAAEDEYFFAEQNARLVQNAEEYYRSMFRGRVSSWNLRDGHMVETVEALVAHLRRRVDGEPKVVIWAHNSHLGDARATDMGEQGEHNVGQLIRQAHGDDAYLVGFTTHDGTVAAASDWGSPVELKQVRPSLPGSHERLFHDAGLPAFLLTMRQGDGGRTGDAARDVLSRERLERAIGVIYLPRSERASHYFEANLAEQFDAVIHYDTTTAVQPLEAGPGWKSAEVPEAYPTGL